MIGTTVSHYEIREKLGGGGMGVVYRAEDTKLHRTVALKFLPPELTSDEVAKERFVQEAQAASALDHPNICTIYDIDETDDGRLFICMAWYNGETVKQALQRGALPLASAVDIALQVSKGLTEAHDKGIVHRDIKPGNVFLTRDGRAKILDFGLAKLAGQSSLTRTGRVVGTAAYMSPEQAKGEGVDQRSDLWSLGIMFHEMVAGERPFAAENERAVLYSICHEPPTPIRDLGIDVPPALASIVERCLDKDPRKRYQTAEDLSSDLTGLSDEISAPAPITRTAPTTSVRGTRVFVRRLAGPAVVVAVAAFLFFHPWGRQLVSGRLGGGSASPERSLAVLALSTADATESDRIFFDGLAEYLTFRLSQLEQFDDSFRMVPAARLRQNEVADPSAALDKTGATLALSGDAARAGDLVHLELRLVDTSTLEPKRTWSLAERMGNVTGLQDEIVARLASELGVELTPEMRSALSVGGTSVPDAFDAYLRGQGYLWRGKGDPAENVKAAAGLFRQAVSEDPGYVLAHAGLGQALWTRCTLLKEPQRRTDAVASLTRAIELDDRLASPHTALGRIDAAAGEYEEAIGEFERALAIDPVNLTALRELAWAYEGAGDLENARRTHERTIRARPRCWYAYADLAVFHRTHGEYEKSVEQLERVLKLVPENQWGYMSMGSVLIETGRREDARTMLERGNEIAPTAWGYANLATLDFHAGRYADAARLYEMALELDDSNPRLWGNLASAYLWLPGKHEDAVDAYREAAARAEEELRVYPQNWELMCLLGGYYAEIGERERALELTERSLTYTQDDVEMMFQAGHNYEVLGDRETALKWVGKALERGYSREMAERTPEIRGLIADPRYKELLDRLGLAEGSS